MFIRSIAPRSLRYATLIGRRNVSTDSPISRRRLPIICVMIAGAGAGVYFLLPASQQDQMRARVHNAKAQTKDHAKEKKQSISEQLDKSRAPKPNDDKPAEEGHQVASRNNEHKMRDGVFSGKEFDNHVAKHTPGNPGKDFECKD